MIHLNMSEEIEYPIRLNRYLYLKGYCSRRKADEYIEKGQVKINGKAAKLGQKVNEEDNVEISKKIKELPKNYEYWILYKPRGVVSHNPQEGEKDAVSFIKDGEKKRLSPVGRLDKESEGLMFLTNDGRIIDKLLNPKYEHSKEYVVRVDKKISNLLTKHLSKGVDIEGYKTKPAKVKQTGDRSFRITLTEGKKHQIRRMCAALGYQVKELKRVRIMSLKLGYLFPGQKRELRVEERLELLKSLGL